MPRYIQFDPTASFTTNSIGAVSNASAVSLYLPFDSNINDASANAHTVTATGGAGISSAQSKFGSNSALFDGSDDALVVSNSSDFNFGTNDFTIELFFYQTNNSSRNDIAGTYSGSTTGWGISTNTSNTNEIQVYFGNNVVLNSGASAYSLNKWHHLVVCRSDSSLKLFIDGKNIVSATNTTNITGGNNLRVGAVSSSANATFLFFAGYIDDFRVTKGIALYDQNFVPPSQAVGASLSGANETNTTTGFTSLYLPFDSDVADDSPHGHSVTASGNAAVSSTQSKFGGSSLYVSAFTDFLTVDSSADFEFKEKDFTIEMFIRPDTVTTSFSSGSYSAILDYDATQNNGAHFTLHQYNSALVWIKQSSIALTTSSCLSATTWHHVVVARANGTLTIYCDGVAVGSISDSQDYDDSNTRNLRIGKQNLTNNTRYFKGYIDDLRILNGFAKYTADFTPPTSPAGTSVSQTRNDMAVLYMPFDDSSFADQARNYLITATGDATLSTSVKKFGTSSAYFDGTGDSFLVNGSLKDFRFANDFTIECQVYPTTSGQDAVLGYHGSSGTSGWILQTGYNSSGGSSVGGRFYTNSGSLILNTSAININTWSHVAITRSGSTVRLFVNGALEDSGTFATQLGPTGGAQDLRIGGSITASTQPFQGYIDDLRIIDGHAVYTAAFTAPTAAVGLAVVGTVTDTRTYASVFSLRSQYTEKAAGNWPT